MFALKHTVKGDSAELGIHCGMIFQFICGKNSLFLFLRKGLKAHIFRQAYCAV
jgi:hypothetical protein